MIKLAEHAVAAAKTGPFRADKTSRLFSSRHHSSRYPDMTIFDFRPTLNAPDDDPYLWLEDVEGERTLAWAATQPARTLGHFGGTQFDRDCDALTAISTIPDKVPVISAALPLSADPALHHEGACVHPGHARKTAAKLQAFDYRAYF